MQSTRFLASNMLRAQPTAAFTLRARATPMIMSRGFRTSMVQRSPVPKQEQAAHTISQRLRSLKRVPPELWPLFIVLAAAIGAAGYSLVRKLMVDKTLRLGRTGSSKHD